MHVKWSMRTQQATEIINKANSRCNGAGCCRQDFKVNFKDVGWNWILFPKEYNAKKCSGGCQLASEFKTTREQLIFHYYSSSVNNQKSELKFSCVPDSFKDTSIIWHDVPNNRIYFENYKDMIVNSCKCVV